MTMADAYAVQGAWRRLKRERSDRIVADYGPCGEASINFV